MPDYETQIELRPQVFEIGDRVRMRLHPQWIGTVKSRNSSAVVSVQWDRAGVQMIDSSLLIPANEQSE